PKNVSHKICGTGEGESHNVTRKTNCRSSAKGGSTGSEVLTNGGDCTKGCGIGSEDSNSDGKALQGTEYDTLKVAFEATDAACRREQRWRKRWLQQQQRDQQTLPKCRQSSNTTPLNQAILDKQCYMQHCNHAQNCVAAEHLAEHKRQATSSMSEKQN
ncbi:MAG: hypothetical protein ACTJLL_03670, partial [Anaplasma sp.]